MTNSIMYWKKIDSYFMLIISSNTENIYH